MTERMRTIHFGFHQVHDYQRAIVDQLCEAVLPQSFRCSNRRKSVDALYCAIHQKQADRIEAQAARAAASADGRAT